MSGIVHLLSDKNELRKQAGVLSLIFVILAPGCLGSADQSKPDIFYGEDINPPRPTPNFVLIDQNDDPVAFNDYLGDVVVVAFLFTRCPDVCPQVSANMAWIADALGDDLGVEAHLLSITVDPWYDNSSVLWGTLL